MDLPSNRMSKPGRKPEGSFDTIPAPPVAIPARVAPCICPLCGKGQHPRVLRTFPEKNFAEVACTSCARKFQYLYSSVENPTPRVRFLKA